MKRILDLIKKDEGFVPSAYQDHLGFWTIGYGRLIDGKKNGGITVDEAEYLLRNDVNAVVARLEETFPWFQSLTEARKAVLISMAYQLGYKGLLRFKKTLSYVGDAEYDKAGSEMLRSNWATVQTPARARRLSIMMQTGEFTDD